ncbi:4'-phosphopantetheinyl transferase family protein [Georgenia yuyongxinii]|uniref:4'-phosphopantetheinyl transferase superfamily protein n=1 Tax=Georgenia yuyongxinii TaxID=2589797 RepID=A0A552WLP5_9MICO|nr:4'-phosphopantetheinyl transferase superfamily protein [Georgenia yuyongxinii]TRW43680.1 4'-phosphopantetheinyl transferase superfamily protein [Georgenia yuyongxinii]
MSVRCDVWWATPSTTGRHHSHGPHDGPAGPAGLPALTRLLEPAERRRAARLVGAARASFVTARALLRLVLAPAVGVAPHELRLDTTCPRCGGDHGKPRLLGPAAVEFSLAHTAGQVVVAVSTGPPVGVDVEALVRLTDQDGAGLLSTAELGELAEVAEVGEVGELPATARRAALAVWWTRKEAVLKATGEGLAVPPETIQVTGPTLPAALLTWPGPAPPPVVTLADLHPSPAFVASVAVLGRGPLTVVEHDGDALLWSSAGNVAHARTA